MATYQTHDFLAPSLYPNTLLSLSIPSTPGPSREPRVRSFPVKHTDLALTNAEKSTGGNKGYAPLGHVKRLVGSKESVVVVDDGFRMSRINITDNEEKLGGEVVAQYLTSHKPGATWTGLISSNGDAIGSLSTGRLVHLSTLNKFTTTRIPSPLLTLCAPSPTLASTSGSSLSTINQFAIAGKEVEISVWDTERTFAVPLHSPAASTDGVKRKKHSLLPGEIWRAKNLPNDNLSLRPPVHHLSSAFLPNSSSDIVTGTKSGHVRRYDTRQRKVVENWKVAREGGIGVVCPGHSEHELFFADHSSLLGSLDLRTGKLLYSIPSLTSTAHHLLSLPPSNATKTTTTLGLASISSDATFRLHRTTPPPSKAGGSWGSVGEGGKKGGVNGMVGGVGVGGFVFCGFGEGVEVVVPKSKEDGEEQEEGEKGEGEDAEVGEDEEEEMWGEMGEIADGDEDEEDQDEDDEDEDSDDEPQVSSKRSRR